ncbi:uncharacterized protein G2W53_008356 [Senna tora]|uniref:Uncharacterized protein n=1 Tax=Senna tora TaxID=362788 RepID=A0A834X813_9FABA|nr:uncharacterized protein G2W53_008356 [Senna tora]
MVVTDEAQREVNMTCAGPTKDNSDMVGTCFKIHGYPEWFKELKEKKAGKKQVAVAAKDSSAGDTPVSQDYELSLKGDLASVVSYLLKEVQRL